MTWQGGYGEQLDVSETYMLHDEMLTADELLPRFRRWLYAVAYAIGADLPVDDVAQEGYIAMWRALKAHDPSKGHVTSWITTAAKARMRDLAQRGREFGHEARRGTVTVEDRVHPVALDELLDAELLVHSPGLLDGIMLAYHRGEIVRAMVELTAQERRYVVLRFWGGMGTTEIATILEVSEARVRQLWSGSSSQAGARAKLRRSLAHLAGAV